MLVQTSDESLNRPLISGGG